MSPLLTFKSYAALFIGIIAIIASMVFKVPKKFDLVEICGKITSIAFSPENRNGNYTTYFTVNNKKERHRTKYIDKSNSNYYISNECHTVCFYVNKNDMGLNGKIYGFEVNDKLLCSADDAIKQDNFYLKISFPIIGAVSVLLFVLFAYLDNKNSKTVQDLIKFIKNRM